VILTVDFGTSVTKVALWSGERLVTMARAELATVRPQLGWAEQDAAGWWTSVAAACAEVREADPVAFGQVEVVSCSAARQTFVPVTATAEPLGRGLLWTDRRAADEAVVLNERLGGAEEVRRRTGVPVDSGAVAAKIAWIAKEQPGRLEASRWLLSPRDLVLWRLTGEVATDRTLASRTGLYDLDGQLVVELAGPAVGKLPPVLGSDEVVGALRAVSAAELGLRPGIPVVVGAGDRQCEVLGAAASAECPMVSWGTTANVSVPAGDRPNPIPPGAVLSRGAAGGWLVEGGLSAAGSFLAWLGRIVALRPEDLATMAAASPPGARGVVAVPWLDGARAPWWSDGARAGFVGLGSAHDVGDLARAVVESVAWDVARCLAVVTSAGTGGKPAVALTLGGAGTGTQVWVDVLTAVTGLAARRRRSGEAASAGAALLASGAVGKDVALDQFDPVVAEVTPRSEDVARYEELRPTVDRVADMALELALPLRSLPLR